jgi:hypothetical protein
MRNFGIIGTSVWRSQRFRHIAGKDRDGAQLTYLYLQTTVHGNSAGTFVLPPEMAALDRQRKPAEVRQHYEELRHVGLIRYDSAEEIVQLMGFYRFNSLGSRKHMAGPLHVIRSLPQSYVRNLAACDLVVAMFERRQEWAAKVRTKRHSKERGAETEVMKLLDAMTEVDEWIADLIREMRLQSMIAAPEVGLSNATLDALCETLSIALSDTPIERRIDTHSDTTETEKETEKTTETDKTKTKTTDKTKTTETAIQRPNADQLLEEMRAKLAAGG